ncbi:MAG: SDR family oxidoreductase [Cyclobacteriaceae bacterium]|nr:SDR family oxidoreductase [Cyclobacteriaceae bacterium]
MKPSDSSTNILVVGATGFLGMEICRRLTAAGRPTRGLVRKTSAAEKTNALKQWNVQCVEGDLKDPASLKAALRGITTVISTASATVSRQDGDSLQSVDKEGQLSLVAEAAAAGVNQFIYISFPNMPFGFPLQSAKRKVEEQIMKQNWSYTILQPTFFMEVWLGPAVGFDFANAKSTIYGEGKKKISWVSLTDVASFAVDVVGNPRAKNKKIELGGPEGLSPLEVVAIFERTNGSKFEVQHVPAEVLQSQSDAAPDDLSKSFAGLMLTYTSGQEVRMNETLKEFPIRLKAVTDYAAQVSKLSKVSMAT